MDVHKSKVWNGLIHGSYERIVQPLFKEDNLIKWAVVYDMSKYEKSIFNNDLLADIQKGTGFTLLIFNYPDDTDLDEDGFDIELFTLIEKKYFIDIEHLLKYLNDSFIDFNLFVPTWKVQFPLGW